MSRQTSKSAMQKNALLYLSQGIVYCTCGHLLKECEANRGFHSMYTGPSLNSKSMSLRRSDPTATDVGRFKNKKTIILPIIGERDGSREDLKGFTIASLKIPYCVNLNSKLIELKKYVSRWTRTGRKISDYRYDARRVLSIQKELVDFSQQFWKIRTGERSF